MTDREKWLVGVIALLVAIWWLFLRKPRKAHAGEAAAPTLQNLAVKVGGKSGCCCAGA